MTSPSIVLLRTQSDPRLVALARDGHERAFEAIVERYRRQLLRTCRRVLPEARAEDALQQALLAAWTAIERGDEIRELRPWLQRIAHNTALNQLRVSGYDFDELHDALRIADAAEDELERRAVMRQTLAALAALPERQREALLAIAVAGRSQDEVASDLGLSSGAVRQLVHRARTSLRTAATALTPLPFVTWIAAAATRSEPMAARIAELSAGAGGAGAATLIAKAGAVAVIAGGAVTGPALVERSDSHRGSVQHARRAAKPTAPRRKAAVLVDAPAAARPVHAARPVPHPSGAAPVSSSRGGGSSRPGDDDKSSGSSLGSGSSGSGSGDDSRSGSSPGDAVARVGGGSSGDGELSSGSGSGGSDLVDGGGTSGSGGHELSTDGGSSDGGATTGSDGGDTSGSGSGTSGSGGGGTSGSGSGTSGGATDSGHGDDGP